MNDYEKMQKLINDADSMIGKDITNDDAEFLAWETSVKRLLYKLFGKDSIEMSTFLEISFYTSSLSLVASDYERHNNAVRSCRNGLAQAKALLESFLDDFDYEPPVTHEKKYDYSQVFIVHGHDGELKESVARIVEKQGIKVIILSEEANKGRTVIEKFEEHREVGGAICLFTADDIGKAKADHDEKTRARQNVVFETGFFIGAIERSHIVILSDRGVEMPSDLSGVVYTDSSNWKNDLLKELSAMGYTVDLNKLI